MFCIYQIICKFSHIMVNLAVNLDKNNLTYNNYSRFINNMKMYQNCYAHIIPVFLPLPEAALHRCS